MGQNSYQCMKTNYTQIKLIFIPVYKGGRCHLKGQGYLLKVRGNIRVLQNLITKPWKKQS